MAERDPSTVSVNYGSVEVATSSAEPPHPATTYEIDCEKEGTPLVRENEEIAPAPKEEQRMVTKSPYPYPALTFIFSATVLQR